MKKHLRQLSDLENPVKIHSTGNLAKATANDAFLAQLFLCYPVELKYYITIKGRAAMYLSGMYIGSKRYYNHVIYQALLTEAIRKYEAARHS